MRSTWRRRLGAAGVAALCPVALVACSGEDEGTAAGKDGAESSDESTSRDNSDFLPTVTDFGEGERKALVFDLDAGDRATTTFSVVMRADGPEMTVTAPIRAVIDNRVLEVSDVFSKVRQTITDVEIDGEDLEPEVAQQLDALLSPAEGFVFESALTPSGEPYRTNFPRTDPAVLQAIHNFALVPSFPFSTVSVTFPAEPVGEGAVWRTTSGIDGNNDGTAVDVTVTYTLIELDGDSYRIDYDLSGGEESSSEGTIAGSGELRGTLRSSVPAAVAGQATTKTGSGATELSLTTDFDVRTESGPPTRQ